MRNAPTAVVNALESGNFEYANLVTINLGDAYDTGTELVLYYTTFRHSLSLGGNTYSTDHSLSELAGISRKASTGSDKVKISFSITDETIVEAIRSERYVNKKTSIDRVIVQNGAILEGYRIPIRAAWALSHTIDGDIGDRAVTLTLDSVLGDLSNNNGWFVLDSSHQQRYPGDSIMKYGQTVMTEEQRKRYTTNFKGVINEQVKPPALHKIYGYRNVEAVPILLLKHRKTHTFYRHYFTTFIYALNIGDCDFVDTKNLLKDDEKFDVTIVNNTNRDVGGWSCRVRTPTDAANSSLLDEDIEGDLSFWFEGMEQYEKDRFIGMRGEGLTLLFVKNRNRDDWLDIPPKLTIPVRGSKVYDPRLGPYYPPDFIGPIPVETSVYSRNPALQYGDYLRSTTYGAGRRNIPVTDATISDLADHFDQIPDSIGNPGINSILIDVMVDTGDSLADNINIWMEGTRLYTSDYYGEFDIRVETKAASVWSFNETDLVEYPTYDSGDFTDRITQLSYSIKQLVPDTSEDAEPGDLVEVDVEAVFPEDGSTVYNQWLAEDGNIINFSGESLSYVTELEQAYYWTLVDARIARQPRTLELVVGPIGWLMEVGDVIDFTSEIVEEIETKWRIDEVTENDDSDVELKLVAYDDTFYTPDPNVIPAPPAPAVPPVSRMVDVTGFALVTINGEYYLTWEVLSTANANWYAIEVLLDDVVVFSNERASQPPVKLTGIAVGSYVATITPFKNDNEGVATTLIFDISIPVAPTITVNVSNFEIQLIPSVPNLIINQTYELEFGLTGTQADAINYGIGANWTITGLSHGTTYYYWIRAVNPTGVSVWVSGSATTTAVPTQIMDLINDPLVEIIVPQIEAITDLIDLRIDDIDTTIAQIDVDFIDFRADTNNALRQEILNRQNTDVQLLSSIADTAAAREELRRRQLAGETLVDALIWIDPSTGTIVNRAFNYTDTVFTQASLLIDGVNASITATVERVELNENSINDLSAELSLVPGQITATATAIVSESIAALEPAHSFNFFDSVQGWVAVNGTITSGLNQVTTTWADIENSALDYVATENLLLRIAIERTAGTGWDGTVIIERDNASTETFANIINEPALTGPVILLVDFTGLSNYSGTVNRVRLMLGETVADEFIIKSITIGKADAQTQDLINLTGRVTQAEIDIDANAGQITSKVSNTDYNANTVTFSNVETTLNGIDSYISLIATRQTIIDNDVVLKANEAGVFIDGYTGTFTAYAQTVQDDFDLQNGLITDAQLEIDAANGKITNQVSSLVILQLEDYDTKLDLLNQLVNSGVKNYEQGERNFTFANAINQLNIDIGPSGSLAQSILTLESLTASQGSSVTALAGRITQAETDIDGNTTAFDALSLTVSSLGTDLTSLINANIDRLDQVDIDVDGNTSAISAVSATVNNATTGLAATYGLVQSAQLEVDGNSLSITNISNTIADPITGLGATSALALSADGKADTNATAISTLSSTVTGVSSTATSALTLAGTANTLAGTADSKADTNATAISSLSSTVTGVSSTATSALTLASTLDDDLDGYRAVSQLTVSAGGVLGFIQLGATPTATSLKIKTDIAQFIDNNNNVFIEFDSGLNKAVFNGGLYAEEIIGDTAAAGVFTMNATGTLTSTTVDLIIINVVISAVPYSRTVIIPLPWCTSSGSAYSSVDFSLQTNAGTIWPINNASGLYNYSGPPFFVTLAANAEARFKLRMTVNSGSVLIRQQAHIIQIIRNTDSQAQYFDASGAPYS